MNPEERLNEFREYFKAHGKLPLESEWPKLGLPSRDYLRYHFGSVFNALDSIGLPYMRIAPAGYDHQQMLHFLRIGCESLGCYPLYWDHLLGVKGIPRPSFLKRYFGTSPMTACRLHGIVIEPLASSVRVRGEIIRIRSIAELESISNLKNPSILRRKLLSVGIPKSI